MPLSPPEAPEPSCRRHASSRKQKSLALICTNFLSLYDRDGIEVIALDDAAFQLGIERRRIYDIVNVLESVGVVARKARNMYTWKGIRAIPAALQELKEEGLRGNLSSFVKLHNNINEKVSSGENDVEDDCDLTIGSQNNKSIPCGSVKSMAASRLDNRKEKSLGLLAQNFVKLFVCSQVNLISLDEAAKRLLEIGHNTSTMRTKVSRLYDIANVLSSLKLIEKTHTREGRRPAFRWLGLRAQGESVKGKRTFGSDVTNVCLKRNRVEDVVKGQGSKCYQFGPFAPVTLAKHW